MCADGQVTVQAEAGLSRRASSVAVKVKAGKASGGLVQLDEAGAGADDLFGGQAPTEGPTQASKHASFWEAPSCIGLVQQKWSIEPEGPNYAGTVLTRSASLSLSLCWRVGSRCSLTTTGRAWSSVKGVARRSSAPTAAAFTCVWRAASQRAAAPAAGSRATARSGPSRPRWARSWSFGAEEKAAVARA